jgi:hypothetical protein
MAIPLSNHSRIFSQTWLRFKIRRHGLGGKREHTFLGTLGRRGKLPDHTLGHVQFWKLSAHCQHVGDRTLTLMRLQHFRQPISYLRRE